MQEKSSYSGVFLMLAINMSRFTCRCSGSEHGVGVDMESYAAKHGRHAGLGNGEAAV